jgi:hypothetical protein
MLSILKCNNYVLAIGLFRASPSNKIFPLDGIIPDMPSERKLNVSLSMKIKGESTSVKVLSWDPFATFNVAVLIHSFVSGNVRSLSHLPVFVIEHLCRAKGATNTKQIK